MPDSIRVPDIPGPYKQLCWQQDPSTLVRCDRRILHDGLHTWEMAAEIKRWQDHEIHTAMQCWKDNEQLKADLAALRQRHEEEVEKAWAEAVPHRFEREDVETDAGPQPLSRCRICHKTKAQIAKAVLKQPTPATGWHPERCECEGCGGPKGSKA